MSEQVYLPRFSKPEDIDEFVAKLEAYERGELTADQFRAFRLVRGVYGQRQTDKQMLRVKIPFGLLGRAQLDAIAHVADTYSRGFGHVTTRQNIQLHFMQMKDAEAAMRRCDEAGLTTREACGNSVRTVTGCECSEFSPKAIFDIAIYAEAMTRYFLGHPLAASLPRKFKIAFSCNEGDCAFAAIHDIGFVAKLRDGQKGFKVYAAGGLSTTPQAAIVLHEFLPAGDIGRAGEAILRMFHTLGNRENRARARLKYVLRKLGETEFRARYEALRIEVDAEAKGELTLPDGPTRTPAKPVVASVAGDASTATAGSPKYFAWRASSVVGQRHEGYSAVYIRLFLGDIDSTQMRALGRIAETFGDGSVRLTVDQNILLPWVANASLPTLFDALAAVSLARLDVHTARDVTSCPGAESCALAVTGSRKLAGAITERLEKSDVDGLLGLAGTVIKVSGCPNSCGQHHIADIGFHGGAKRDMNAGTTYPIYQLHLGGGVDANGAYFGRQVVKVLARRAPEAVVLLLRLFETDKKPDDTPKAFFRTVDPKRVVAALAPVLGPPTPDDLADIGETVGFQVETGVGECAA
jgi:sulfite reductase beta subunit-like hemoprotein